MGSSLHQGSGKGSFYKRSVLYLGDLKRDLAYSELPIHRAHAANNGQLSDPWPLGSGRCIPGFKPLSKP